MTLTPWTQLVSVEQVAGSPVDPLPMGDTGTGFDGDLFRWVFLPHTSATNADGHQESVGYWSEDLLGLYSGFNPATDSLEIAADFHTPGQFALGTNDGAGVFIGVADAALGGTENALVCGLRRSGVSNHGFSRLNTTSSTGGGNGSSGGNDRLYANLSFLPAASSWRGMAESYARVAGSSAYDIASNAPSGEPLSTTLANWKLVTGVFHASTTSPVGLDIRWKLYHRLVRRASGLLA